MTLGVKLNSRFDFGEAYDQIKKQIDKQKVTMMIFDEVQHFTEGTLDSYQAADVIKIMMKCRVQVVCVGKKEMLKSVEGENANDQLLRLRKKQAEIKPLECSLDDFVAADGTVRGEVSLEKEIYASPTRPLRLSAKRSTTGAIQMPSSCLSTSCRTSRNRIWLCACGERETERSAR